MDVKRSIGIARALINRYGLQAQAIAEERANLMAQEDPGTRYFWEQVPAVVCEFRRTGAAKERSRGRQPRH
jgi:hypothetical protein